MLYSPGDMRDKDHC